MTRGTIAAAAAAALAFNFAAVEAFAASLSARGGSGTRASAFATTKPSSPSSLSHPFLSERRSSVAPSSSSLSATNGDDCDPVGRRAAISRGIVASAAAAAAFAFAPLPASAKSKKEPVTPENVSSAFGAVRSELEDAVSGVGKLESLIAAEDYPSVMEFTKTYDLDFRKAKMGRARKLLTDGAAKDDALTLSNAVTFDLIGINKNSRPGKESREGAEKYLGELKEDVRKFLELEGTVDFAAAAAAE